MIDVSAASSLINAGNAEFIASAYLGSAGGVSVGTQMAVAFQNAGGQTFNTVTVGPIITPEPGVTMACIFSSRSGSCPRERRRSQLV